MRHILQPSAAQTSILLLVVFLSAAPAHAAVVINEIAWMGTAASPTDEWIEIANTGNETVDLSGWAFSIEGEKDIPLSGSIPAGGLYLIERTDDSTVPGIPADLIAPFGSGLNNTAGEKLVIFTATREIADSVVSGENWGAIGGDKDTKETAQRTSSGWITAPATPRAATPQSSGNVTTANSASETFPPSSATAQGGSAYVPPPRLSVEIRASTRAAVGADQTYVGTVYGIKNEPIAIARMVWNFGDGTVKEGKTVMHTFRHPGSYIVVLEAASGEYSGSARLNVTAAPPEVAIVRSVPGSNGLIELKNSGSFDLDISYWQLKSGTQAFSFPLNTFIPARSSVTFSAETTGISADPTSTVLLFPNGVEVTRFGTPVATAVPKQETEKINKETPVTVSKPIQVQKTAPAKGEARKSEEQKNTKDGAVIEEAAESSSGAVVAESGGETNSVWLWGLFGIVGVALLGIAVKGRGEKEAQGTEADVSDAHLYDISEEKPK